MLQLTTYECFVESLMTVALQQIRDELHALSDVHEVGGIVIQALYSAVRMAQGDLQTGRAPFGELRGSPVHEFQSNFHASAGWHRDVTIVYSETPAIGADALMTSRSQRYSWRAPRTSCVTGRRSSEAFGRACQRDM